MFTNKQLSEIFEKTKGHCHFCGDSITFNQYAKYKDINGSWEIDHVIQRGKGGTKDISNCLPACTRCNRLRWHRTGNEVRELLIYGLIAKDEIKKKSDIGKILISLKDKRQKNNLNRRKNFIK